MTLATAIAALACAGPAQAVRLGSADVRRPAATAAVPASIAVARRAERAGGGRLGVLQVAADTGGVRMRGRLDGLLTAASGRPAAEIGLDYVRARPAVFGLDAADLSGLRLVRHYAAGGIEQLRWAQSYRDITAIDSSLTANLTASGRLVNVLGEPRHDLALGSTSPRVDAAAAFAAAARAVGARNAPVRRASPGAERVTAFAGGGGARLVIYERGGPRLGWRLLVPVDRGHVYDAVVDAGSGRVERQRNIVASAVDAHVYRNYPGAAAGGTPETVDLTSTLNPGATTLLGPDAHTFTDAGDVVRVPGDDPPAAGEVVPGVYDVTDPNSPDCAPLPCIWAPGVASSWTVNRQADATQLHWSVSSFHDYLRDTPEIAFDAAAGAFDGDDPLLAQSMDGADTDAGLPDGDHVDNANMATYPDGTSPQMQMYLTSRGASTAFDAAVVYHEYSHGFVERTITDAAGFSALGGAQGGALDEGLADLYALDYLVGQGLEADAAGVADVRLGVFAFGTGGTRSEPTDCPVAANPQTPDAVCGGGLAQGYGGYTYADLGTIDGEPEVHADGEIWTQTLWELRQRLIADLGAATGTSHLRRLVTTALRLSPPNPSFLDLRNAILQAAAAVLPADTSAIWQVFARRGMGYFASTTSADDLHPIADTHLPPAPGDPSGTVSGTVTDTLTAGPAGAGVRVSFSGHDTGIGPELSATTNAAGAYAIAGVAPGTYPLLRVRGSGYVGEAVNVTVAASPAVTTRNFSLLRNVASSASGAQIAGLTGPDFGDNGCGPEELIDGDPALVWGTTGPSHPPVVKEVVVELAAATDVTGIEIDPSAGCGDDDNASLGQYEVQASTTGVAFTTIASGTFHASDLDRNNAVSLSAVPAGVRYLKLRAKTAQSGAGSGAEFIDVAELRAFGTPTPPAPPPPPPVVAPPPPPPVVTPPPPPPPRRRRRRSPRTGRRRCCGSRARRFRSSARACASGCAARARHARPRRARRSACPPRGATAPRPTR